MNEEVLVLKTKLESAEALRETLERTHASEMRASTRRAEAAEAEARLLVREKKEKEKAARDATRGDGPVDILPRKELSEEDVVCVSRGDVDVVSAHHQSSRESPEEPEEPKEPPIDGHDDARNASNATARAYEELDAHRRSIQTHLEALQRDRETLAMTKRTVSSESYL